MLFHFLGDSHASIFSGSEVIVPIWPKRSIDKIKNFRSYRLGSLTAYNLENKKHIIDEILNSEVSKNNDVVVFCFGEIDTRAHILKQRDIQLHRNVEDIIHECAYRYWTTIHDYHLQGFKIGIWGVCGAWSKLKPYSGPSYGLMEERNSVIKLFNNFLETKAIETGTFVNGGIFYASIFDLIVSRNNVSDVTFFDKCGIHLSNKALPHIIDKISQISQFKSDT